MVCLSENNIMDPRFLNLFSTRQDFACGAELFFVLLTLDLHESAQTTKNSIIRSCLLDSA